MRPGDGAFGDNASSMSGLGAPGDLISLSVANCLAGCWCCRVLVRSQRAERDAFILTRPLQVNRQQSAHRKTDVKPYEAEVVDGVHNHGLTERCLSVLAITAVVAAGGRVSSCS